MAKTLTDTQLFRTRFSVAVLALVMAFGTASGADAQDDPDVPAAKPARPVDPPRRVSFKLIDDVRITGDVTSWDDEGFDGSFGRRQWTELNVDDAWNLYIAVADRNNAEHWISLGRIMMLAGDPTRSEYAFRKALTIDPSVDDEIKRLKESVRSELLRQRLEKERTESAKLRTTSPEAERWIAEPWPVLTAQEMVDATTAVKTRAHDIVTKAGMTLTPIETELIVLYTDAPRPEAAKWVIRLERAYKRLCRLFEIHSSQNVFHGKAVVFVFTNHDRFRLVEAGAFNQLVPQSAIGLCHYDGPDVYLCFHQHEDAERFLWELMHQFTHGFMHRMVSAARMPAWANEGLAHYVAAEEMRSTLIEKDRRARALDFIRSGGDVFALLDRTYEQFEWTETWSRYVEVCGLVVELMIRERPGSFQQFVQAIKRGKEWRDAMSENFGVDARRTIETAIQHYRVND